MSAHTPTPWELDGTYLVGRTDEGRMLDIADFARSMSASIPLGKANAAYAHKAVNLHEELLAALHLALARMEGGHMDKHGRYTASFHDDDVEPIRAAIAKAEGHPTPSVHADARRSR